MLYKFFVLISICFLISCSHSINVKAPVHKFLTAEAQGKTLKGRASIYAINGSEVTVDISNNETDNPLDIWAGNIDPGAFGLTGELGVYGPVDFVYVSGGSLGTSIFAFKGQVFGSYVSDSKEQDFSLALLAGYGSESKKEHEGEEVELWPKDDDTSTNLKVTGLLGS